MNVEGAADGRPGELSDDRSSTGAASIVALATLGAVAVWLLARPAPEAVGAARLRSPEILLAVFDTVWLLLVAAPRESSWPSTLTKLVVGAPFHAAIAAACGAGPGFHVACALTTSAFAAVGTIGARVAPAVHGLGLALLAFALPLTLYAAGEFGGVDVRALFLATPTVGPTILARTSTIVVPGDAVPALVAAAILFALDLAASRSAKTVSA